MILAIWATVERRAGSQSSQGESIKSRQVSSYRSSYLLPPLLPPTAAPTAAPTATPTTYVVPPLLHPTSYRRSYLRSTPPSLAHPWCVLDMPVAHRAAWWSRAPRARSSVGVAAGRASQGRHSSTAHDHRHSCLRRVSLCWSVRHRVRGCTSAGSAARRSGHPSQRCSGIREAADCTLRACGTPRLLSPDARPVAGGRPPLGCQANMARAIGRPTACGLGLPHQSCAVLEAGASRVLEVEAGSCEGMVAASVAAAPVHVAVHLRALVAPPSPLRCAALAPSSAPEGQRIVARRGCRGS